MRIDIVFDKYDVRDSIKSMERLCRVTNGMGLEVKIHNPSTPLPSKGDKHMCNQKNNTAFVTFISNYLADKARSSLQPGNILVIGGGLQNSDLAMCVVMFGNAPLIQRLTCNHEEAGTRMLLLASCAADMVSRVMIASPDTDVAVLLCTTDLLFKTAVKDLVRYTLIHDIARELGSEMFEPILAFHALTACDSTSCLRG